MLSAKTYFQINISLTFPSFIIQSRKNKCCYVLYWYSLWIKWLLVFTPSEHWFHRQTDSGVWGGFYQSSCCCCFRSKEPWPGSFMPSPGEQGRRGSAVWTRDTLQVSCSTRSSHHAGKSTGRCTLDRYRGKREESAAFPVTQKTLFLELSFSFFSFD